MGCVVDTLPLPLTEWLGRFIEFGGLAWGKTCFNIPEAGGWLVGLDWVLWKSLNDLDDITKQQQLGDFSGLAAVCSSTHCYRSKKCSG